MSHHDKKDSVEKHNQLHFDSLVEGKQIHDFFSSFYHLEDLV